jgi:hypothetical protein
MFAFDGTASAQGNRPGVTTMAATMEYKEYRIETEQKDGEWFATIGRLDGLEVRSRAGRDRLRTRVAKNFSWAIRQIGPVWDTKLASTAVHGHPF